MENRKTTDFDVAIIGLGPTGATLAALLADMGRKVLVLDREADIYDLPRAVHFDDEIMRVLQWIGIADDFQDDVVVNKGMRFVDMDGNLLLDWPRPQTITSNGWNASYRFHQPDLERALRKGLAARENVKMLLSHELQGVTDHGDHVTFDYRDKVAGSGHSATALFVVGCDGANSTIRRVIESPMESLGFHQRWLVVDVMLKHEMPQLGDHTLQYCDPETPFTYCRNVGLRRRWEFAVSDAQTNEEASNLENVWARLSTWISPKNADIERRAMYTFKSEVARDWVKGRLMIAGDAAHLTPPFMGQGLCAGIRDAANLAWKLNACCGAYDKEFLQSYETERKPVATQYIRTAVQLGELINRMGASGKVEEPQTMKSLQAGLGEGLGDSADAARGQLFGQPVLSNGVRLDDEVKHAAFFVTSDPDALESDGRDVRIFDTKTEPALCQHLDYFDAQTVLVRPDKRVLGSARSSEKIPALIKVAERLTVAIA